MSWFNLPGAGAGGSGATDHSQLTGAGDHSHAELDDFLESRGQPGGLAELDETGRLPAEQLPPAAEDAFGAVELASVAEAAQGEDAARAVTPAGVRAHGDARYGKILTANRTLNFTSSMTAAAMQAEIDAQPRNLGGYILTVQFANGSYALEAPLYFRRFQNGGVYSTGNPADNSLSETKSVVLNFTTAGAYGLYFENVLCPLYCRYLKTVFNQGASNEFFSGIMIDGCLYLNIDYCAVLGANSTHGRAVRVTRSHVQVLGSMVGNVKYGIESATLSKVYSAANGAGAILPAFGIRAQAATIYKNGTQPAGSTANEAPPSYGGQILG